jgi:outer membrane protein assembly factor BamA
MVSPSLYSDNINGSFFKLGPTFEVIRVRENRLFDPNAPNLFIEDQQRFDIFDTQTFGGLQFISLLHNLANPLNPKQGFRWINMYDYNRSLQNDATNYLRLYSDLSIYYSPFLSPQVTWANRIGGSHNFGDFPFYHANTLGGNNNLRGFRTNRFTGRSSAFYNTELRMRVSRISSYLLVGDFGWVAFFDTGRVWDYQNDTSRKWHQGYGAGIWINLFDFLIINNQFGFSEEGSFYYLRAGFQF